MPVLQEVARTGRWLVQRSAASSHQNAVNPHSSNRHIVVRAIGALLSIRDDSTSASNITTSVNSEHSTQQNASLPPNYSNGLTGVNLELDEKFVKLIWVSMVGVTFIVLVLRLWQLCYAYMRELFCLSAGSGDQTYWKINKNRWWPWLKREVLYAPLGTKRHNREIQLSSAINYGTLPGRIHACLLVGYAVTNIAYCLILPYGKGDTPRLVAELRGRTGMLATVNLIPLVLMAGRNNPAIILLNLSFDTFNLFHRWIGRIVIVEAVVHVCAWYFNYSKLNPGKPFIDIFSGNTFLTAGLFGIIAMSVILFQSLSPVRHAFYEVFLHLHIFLAFTAILSVYVHVEMHKLPALPYIRAAIVVWICERTLRIARLIYLNCSWRKGLTYVTVEALPANACRVTFQLPRHVHIRPGSHIYAYIPRIALWQSHPFSVAWTSSDSQPLRCQTPSDSVSITSVDTEKQAKDTSADKIKAPTAVSLVVAARTGMTRKLYDEAKKGTLRLFGLVEGPYSGHDSLSSYGTVVMFAGGAGITHHLVQIRFLLACAQEQTVATRKIHLIWTVRDLSSLSWVRPWMDEILKMPGRRDILTIELYVTRPQEARDYISPSSTVQLFAKRCDPGMVLDRILPDRVGATMVTICGPGAFADEVRAAVRKRIHVGCIDMNEEAFTW